MTLFTIKLSCKLIVFLFFLAEAAPEKCDTKMNTREKMMLQSEKNSKSIKTGINQYKG